MFIAMNRFCIVKGKEIEFARIWAEQDSHMDEVSGFKEFNLLRGPEEEDHTIYASLSVWQSKQHFEDWTKSEAFRKAHANAGSAKDIYHGHPPYVQRLRDCALKTSLHIPAMMNSQTDGMWL